MILEGTLNPKALMLNENEKAWISSGNALEDAPRSLWGFRWVYIGVSVSRSALDKSKSLPTLINGLEFRVLGGIIVFHSCNCCFFLGLRVLGASLYFT